MSILYLGTIEEWDFVRLQPFHSVNLSSGPIWCLKWDPSRMVIAAGCENGKVVVVVLFYVCFLNVQRASFF